MGEKGWLSKWIDHKNLEKRNKKTTPIQWLILLAAIGVGIMIITDFITVKEDLPPNNPQEILDKAAFGTGAAKNLTMKDYEEMYESELKEILEQMVGVDSISVMVNLDSTEERVIEKNRNTNQQLTKERDTKGSSRDIEDRSQDVQVVLKRTDNGEEPIVLKTLKPRVRGVLIVANGVENAQVRVWITEAVQRVLDVPVHNISILPKKK
ncbi:stage III sporulation protein AG [Microaerobacter geothermalis]|uniref:stage III sporulation protein AG n=1 Tax=Microaerobacter geothermalis TaxID=674972 RepID=UPI001F1EAF07|nr:stage III sporulation protein AG [Microaerobacter geothermalis]MCF6094451.1 stage III sporulation protein AG [Microaerobacter geothermalis]